MRSRFILFTIIFSQFACTSLWFAGNAVIDRLSLVHKLNPEIAGHVLSAVQFGFIVGTLLFAVLLVTDRFSPSKVFFCCAILGALCNLPLMLKELSLTHLLTARFATGFFLAGIYPVGMKIASDYFEKGLGKALGLLVGALVLGSAIPYLINEIGIAKSYTTVLWATSALAVLGGSLIRFGVPDGPYRKPMAKLELNVVPKLFKIDALRRAALGYFGHMWELYAFWAFTPLAFKFYIQMNGVGFSIPLWTFVVIAAGAFSCILGGYLSLNLGSKKVALVALSISGICCLVSPLLFLLPLPLFLLFWCFWGMAVTADSPQFSTMVANAATNEVKGTALTLVNCIGFAITILSIELIFKMADGMSLQYILPVLAIGPLFGILYARKI